MDGIIIVNKPKGYTSHDVVNKIRKIYNTKKVGHTGTLDPNATGVLPILIGRATKLSEYLIDHDKTYVAIIKLGEKRDTGDSEGKVIQTQDVKEPSKESVKEVLNSFLGKQLQTPPMYSAIKVGGKKLYEYAREGVSVEIPKREIEIYNIELNNIKGLEIEFTVKCSKGTYIRSLCEEIAKKLGVIGYMKELTRIEVDKFSIENSYTLQKIEENKDNIKLLSIEEVFKSNESIILNEEKLTLFFNGGRIKVGVGVPDNPTEIVRIYNSQNRFIGTGIVNNNILKRHLII